MTLDEYDKTLGLLKSIHLDPKQNLVTFCASDYTVRGVIVSQTINPVVLLIECIDAFDTSGAGNDFVALPLSKLVQIKHDAKKARYERNKFAETAKTQLKGK